MLLDMELQNVDFGASDIVTASRYSESNLAGRTGLGQQDAQSRSPEFSCMGIPALCGVPARIRPTCRPEYGRI